MNRTFDIIVAGAGMVGASAALSLARSGYQIALVEPVSMIVENASDEAPYSERVSAITPTSEQLINGLGVWSKLNQNRLGRYEQMHIWHENGDASIHFDSTHLARESLGTIIENNQILRVLLEACGLQPEIEWFRPDAIKSITENSQTSVSLRLNSGVDLDADLLLIAEGRSSTTRELAGFETLSGSYDQIAIVANVVTEYPHQQTAWQRFLTTGPLAMLPLANGERSMVWSCGTERATELLEMNDNLFCSALSNAFEGKLGEVKSIGKRLSYPLGWHNCNQWLHNRILLIGDTAHGVHPLAGQGVNLGYSDVDLLTHLIGNLDHPWHKTKLRQFERQRKSETAIATHLFSGMKWVYGTNNGGVSSLRNLGMHLVESNSCCKRFLMQKAIQNMV